MRHEHDLRGMFCWLLGHTIETTGLHGISLVQVRCVHCQRMFMHHLDLGGLIPWDWCCERFALDHGWRTQPTKRRRQPG